MFTTSDGIGVQRYHVLPLPSFPPSISRTLSSLHPTFSSFTVHVVAPPVKGLWGVSARVFLPSAQGLLGTTTFP